jgi:outer membrane autotransporter protein
VPWGVDPSVLGLSACTESGWTPWLATWGEFAEREGTNAHIDYETLGGDLALGADRRVGERWLLTGYLGTGGSEIEVGAIGEAQLYSAEVGAAAAFALDGFSARGAAAYGHGWHHTRRDIRVGSIMRSARSDHASDRVTAELETGYAFDLGTSYGWFLEPLASLDGTWIGQESLDEQGAASLDLSVDSRSDFVLSSMLGLRVGSEFVKAGYNVDWLEWANGVWRPEITAGWREIWTGRERDLDARLSGAPAGVGSFTVSGDDEERGAQVGARVLFQPAGTRIQAGLDFDGFFGDGTDNYFVGLELRVPIP